MGLHEPLGLPPNALRLAHCTAALQPVRRAPAVAADGDEHKMKEKKNTKREKREEEEERMKKKSLEQLNQQCRGAKAAPRQ